MSVVEEMVKADPTALIDLYEMDVRDLPGYSPLDFEYLYDVTPAESLYVETNWPIVGDRFYSPPLDDYSDWTQQDLSSRSWYTSYNTEAVTYLGIFDNIDDPAFVNAYYMLNNTLDAYVIEEFSSGIHIDLTTYNIFDYGTFSAQTGSFHVFSNNVISVGDRWRAFDFNYTITENTVLELEYIAGTPGASPGTIHGIGMSPYTVNDSTIQKSIVYTQNRQLGPYDIRFVRGVTFSDDGTWAYFVCNIDGKQGVISYYMSTPWSLGSWESSWFTDLSANIIAPVSTATTISDIAFSADGYLAFVSSFYPKEVHKYSLETPWLFTNVTYQGIVFDSTTFADPVPNVTIENIHFSTDGTKFYIGGNDSTDLSANFFNGVGFLQFDLTAAYNLTTASYVDRLPLSEIYKTILTSAEAATFSSDGSVLFLAEWYGFDAAQRFPYVNHPHPSESGVIYQFNLSIPWTISSATFKWEYNTYLNYYDTGYSDSGISFGSYMFGLQISANGSKLFVLTTDYDTVREYFIHEYDLKISNNLLFADGTGKSQPYGYVIQIDGYERLGEFDYRISTSYLNWKKFVIPIGTMYTGDMKSLFMGQSGSTSISSQFSVIKVYEGTGGEGYRTPLFRGSQPEFPTNCLVTSTKDSVAIFDASKDDRPIWMIIPKSSVGNQDIVEVDISSGMLFIRTAGGLWTYDFIKDIWDSKLIGANVTSMAVSAPNNVIDVLRLNQPKPILAYIDSGSLFFEYPSSGGTYSIVNCDDSYNGLMDHVVITKAKELMAFTSDGDAYYFGPIADLRDNFTAIQTYKHNSDGQEDAMFGGIISAETDYVYQVLKQKLYAKISSIYNTGYYTENTTIDCACSGEELNHDGKQIVKNPDFDKGTSFYEYTGDWKYDTQGTFNGINCYGDISQDILTEELENHVLSIHVSDFQGGRLVIVLEKRPPNLGTDGPDIQYLIEDGGSFTDDTSDVKVRYINHSIFENSEVPYEEIEIPKAGVFSFLLPIRTYSTNIIIRGYDFTGEIEFLKIKSISNDSIYNRIPDVKDIEVYGPMVVSKPFQDSDIMQYADGTVVLNNNLNLENNFLYYWQYNGVVWEFIYEDHFDANIDAGVNKLYVECTRPKALIRLTTTAYTEEQLNIIRQEEQKIFKAGSRCMFSDYSGTISPLVSVTFDDVVGHWSTEVGENVQRFTYLTHDESLPVKMNAVTLNAYNNSVTMNDFSEPKYHIYYFGDGTGLSEKGVYRFYAGTNQNSDPVTWQGMLYMPFPLEIKGYDYGGDREIPRPTITIGNIVFMMTDLILKYNDLLNAKVTRKRTFAKYLDSVNFIGGNVYADPDIEFPDEVYYINKKLSENFETITFELVAPWDVEGVKLPRRIVSSRTCPWRYKGGEGCSYSGTRYFDIYDNPIPTEEGDVCGKTLNSCELRFVDESIPFGGFPSVGL